jgi:hypothetical protein
MLAATVACDGGPPARTPAVRPIVQERRESLAQVGGVASRIDPDGTARFVRAVGAHPVPPGAVPAEAAAAHVAAFAPALGLSREAAGTLELDRVHDLGERGAIVMLRQRVGGVDVLDGELRVLVRRDGSLVALSGTPSPLAAPGATPVFRHRVARGRKVLARDGGALVPAWVVTDAHARGTSREEFRTVVAAGDLRVLARHSTTARDAFQYRVWADAAGDLRPADGPLADYTPHPSGMADGSEPPFVAPVLVSIDGLNGPTDPWLPAGATETSGNNVDA